MNLDCQLILDSVADAVMAADEEGRILYANPAVEKLLGWSAAELVGQPLTAIIPPRLHEAHHHGFHRFRTTRQAQLIGHPVRVPALCRDETEVEVELTLSAFEQEGRLLFVGSLRDLRDRVELERQLTVTRYLRAATAAAAQLAGHRDLESVFQTVVRTLATDFDGALARIWLYEPGTHTLHLQASAGLSTETASSPRATIDVASYPYKVGEIARTRKPFVRNGLVGDPQFDQEWVLREGLVSAAGFPLLSGGELRGVFIYFSRQELHPEVVHVLETFATLAAASLNDVLLLMREQEARAEAERRRAEAERERDFVRHIVGHAPLGIAVTEGPDHRFTLMNPAGEKMLGLAASQILGRTISDLALEADQELRHVLGGVLRTGEAVVLPELEVRLPGGGLLYAHVAYAPLLGADGKPAGVIHLGLDITERKRAEAALRRQAYLLDTVEQAVIATDLHGVITYWNRYAERLFGWPAAEVLGRNIIDVTPTEATQAQAEAIMERLRAGQSWAGEFMVRRRDGSAFPVWLTDTPIRDAAGNLTGIIGVSTDLTELKRAEEELRRQRELLRTITNNADSALVMVDVENRLTYVNPAFTRITGFAEEDVLGARLHDTVHHLHPDGRPYAIEECPIDVASASRRSLRGHEDVFVRKDGTFFHSVSTLAPLEEDGETVGGVVEFRDVTEEKARERTLNFLVELNEATRQLSEPADIMATAARLLGEHLAVSRCAYAPVEDDEDHFVILGDHTRGCKSIVGRYPLTAFGRRALRELRAGQPYIVHDIDREAPPDEDLAAYRITEIQAVVCVSLIKSGRLAALMAIHQTVPRQWTAEEVRLLELVAERCWADIERAEADKQLRDTAARLSLALTSARMGPWTWDAATDRVQLSERGAEIFGMTSGVGVTWSEMVALLHEEDREPTRQAVTRVIAERSDYDVEYRVVLPDGGLRWVSARGQALYTPEGALTGMLGLVQDVTEQKLIEESLRDADRRKDEFLAMLGHELRNPLGSISNALHILRRRAEDPAVVHRYLEMLERQSALMSRLVGDMQDVSRIKTGKLVLRSQPLSVGRVMREAAETVSGLVAEREHELTVMLPGDDVRVHGDAARLTQVFANLLSNAAKYTAPGGRICFCGERSGDEVIIRVVDTGMGIAPEALPSIFELFSQSERTLGESREGLGIGLSLVRGLVQMHGGVVTASSPGLGQGSEFLVRLPALEETPAARQTESPDREATV